MSDEKSGGWVEEFVEGQGHEPTPEMAEVIKLAQAIDPVLRPHPSGFALHLLASVVAHQIYIRTGFDARATLSALTEFQRDVGNHIIMSFQADLPVADMVMPHPGAPDGGKAN